MLAVDTVVLLAHRRVWIWGFLHLGLAIFLCTWPGLRKVAGTPGWEFAFLQGLLAALSAGHLGVMGARRVRECGPARSPGGLVSRAFGAAFATSLLLLAPPLFCVLLAGFWNGQCDYLTGILFYLLLPVMSALLSASVGTVLGLTIARRAWPMVAFVAVALGSLAFSVWRLLSEAPVFGYDPFFGYFPGAIYDELLAIQTPLLAFRAETLALAASALLVARAFADPVAGRLRLRSFRLAALGRAVPAVAAAALLRASGGDLGYAVTTADIAAALGGRHETEHFVIYYPRKSALAKRLGEIAMDHEFRFDQLRRFLGVAPPGKVHSFLYESQEQKARLMGARQVSIAKPWVLQMHLNDLGTPHPVLRHELAHVFGASFGSWLGVSAKNPFAYNVGLIEGLAVAADWSLGHLTGHQWSRAALEIKGKRAPRIEDLVGVTGFWSEGASLAYTLCGSFVRFLIDQHGPARFRAAYARGDLEEAYGKSLPELAREWKHFLGGVRLTAAELEAAERRFRVPSIFRRTCAHEVARVAARARGARLRGDLEREVELRRRALEVAPEDPGHLEALAETLLRAGRHEEAGATLEAAAKGAPGTRRRIAELRGDLYWKLERLRDARETYAALLRERPPPEAARRLAVKIAALDHPVAGPRVRRLLLDDSGDASLRLLEMRELVAAAPGFAVAPYLLGRQLVQRREYREAARWLAEAVRLGLPGPDLGVEARRLLGIATYHLRDYTGAVRHFTEVVHTRLSEGSVLDANDWIERCNFARFRSRQLATGGAWRRPGTGLATDPALGPSR